MAGMVFQTAFWTVLAIFLVVGIIDAALIAWGRESITEWLIANPSWFWWTAGILIGGSVILGLHLWLESPS